MTIVPDAKRMAKRANEAEDRHVCPECRNLRGGVCTAAESLPILAQRGWKPSVVWHTEPHRCGRFSAAKDATC